MDTFLTKSLHIVSIGVIAITTFFSQAIQNHNQTTPRATITKVASHATTSLSLSNTTTTKQAKQTSTSTSFIGPKIPLALATTTKNKNIGLIPAKELIKAATEKDKLKITLNTDTPAKPLISLAQLNTEARSAVVNILCNTAQDGLRPLSGSGMIIDDRGVILTNAHIGQYFLLRDFPKKDNVDCIIRAGAPAHAMYRGELLFISPPWVEANKKNITEEDPTGTGENDFALILITSSVNAGERLPATFPHVSYNTEDINADTDGLDNFVIVGYPAGFLGSLDIYQNLFISSTVSQLKKLYTFKEKTIDLLSFGGSVLAQKGASGGGVVRQKDEALVGIVVTTTEAKTTGDRDLHAISISHINRSIEASTNKTLAGYLLGDLNETLSNFKNGKFQYLKNILVNELTS
jgi:hypothetical protein